MSNILAIITIIICVIIILFGLWILNDTRKMKAKGTTNNKDKSVRSFLRSHREQSK